MFKISVKYLQAYIAHCTYFCIRSGTAHADGADPVNASNNPGPYAVEGKEAKA